MEKRLYQEHHDLENRHWWFVSKRKIILSQVKKVVNPNKKCKILDAGCGTGHMLNDLKLYGETYGMDNSPDAITFTKTKFSGEIKQGLLPDNVPYSKNQFDLILCLDVIEHIDDDFESLITLRKLLKEDGRLILTVPALPFLWSKWDELNEHKRRYTRKQLIHLIIQSGFAIEKISFFNSLLFPLVLLFRLFNNIFHKDKVNSDTDLPRPFINYLFGKIFSFENNLLRFGNFPIGVSLLVVAKKA